MLRNVDQRKEFLLNDKSWRMIYELKPLGLRYYQMDFSDGTSLIRTDRYGNISANYISDIVQKWRVENYRRLEDGQVDYNVYQLGFCVEYIKHRELKESIEKSKEPALDDFDLDEREK